MQTPRTEFAQALKAITTERGLDPEVIIDTIEQAIVAAYKRDARDRGEDVEEDEFEVEINPINGEAKIYSWPPDQPEEKKDITPPGFGRIAAQTAKQVIHQKIREAEKSSIMDEFSDRVGNLVSGVILRFDGPNVRVDLGRTEGIMPAEERTPNERLSASQRLTFLLKEIIETPRGKEVLLSRSDPEFVEKLFAREVPEIGSGSVEIRSLAREAGVRTKMTVFSNQAGVDPVGSCVGQKGVRVQAVTNELDGERVDIIPWSDDEVDLVAAALSPAEGVTVTLDEDTKIAKVKAPDDQLSLAIGKDGQNARLAAKLTGWKIEVEVDESAPKTKKDGDDEEGVEEKVEEKETKTKKSKIKKGEEEVEKKEDKKTAVKKKSTSKRKGKSVTNDNDNKKDDTKEPKDTNDKGKN